MIINNSIVFSNWSTSPFKIQSDNLLISTAKEFDFIETLYRKNTTFYSLINSQKTCIDLFIRSRFETDLVDEIILNNSLTAEKSIFRGYIQNALANFTISTAMEKNIVKFSKNGIVQLEQDKDTASQIQSKADLTAISSTIKKYEDIGHRYINLANAYMNKNTSAFGLTTAEETFTKTRPWM